ncbi:MAG: UDP-N-acetylglucosamine 2-epimerase (hydrolyzing) [Phycisphaerales bacterium]|nr:MAG: UDP-N-acetylglucosamine 2-epimerase (hydrolyzing) [Phycisphaerales bacterium]
MSGAPQPLRVAVVTGTRAEFGLLAPVMRAVRAHEGLTLQTIVCGAHLLPPTETWREVERAFGIDARVEMQRPGEIGRLHDARALGRGVAGMADAIERLRPDWVVVLGDRVEALAGAAAASVGGVATAHIHGGDVAEGVADEAMRHAITKLSHLHLAASEQSARRITRMGERPEHVRITGSPALDGLYSVVPMDDDAYARLGSPRALVLMHPIGRDDAAEQRDTRAVLEGVASMQLASLALHPNYDAGRDGVLRAIELSGVRAIGHLPRPAFLSLLSRLARDEGVLVGNSSCALIEAGAMRPALAAVDIGPRQAGRERASNVVHASDVSAKAVASAINAAHAIDLSRVKSPYGDGRAGERIAAALAAVDPRDPKLLRKRHAD